MRKDPMIITRKVPILNWGHSWLVLSIVSRLPVEHPTSHHVARRRTGGLSAKVELTACNAPFLSVCSHAAKVYHKPCHAPEPFPRNSLAAVPPRCTWLRLGRTLKAPE